MAVQFSRMPAAITALGVGRIVFGRLIPSGWAQLPARQFALGERDRSLSRAPHLLVVTPSGGGLPVNSPEKGGGSRKSRRR